VREFAEGAEWSYAGWDVLYIVEYDVEWADTNFAELFDVGGEVGAAAKGALSATDGMASAMPSVKIFLGLLRFKCKKHPLGSAKAKSKGVRAWDPLPGSSHNGTHVSEECLDWELQLAGIAELFSGLVIQAKSF